MGECIFNFNFLDSIDQDEIKSNLYYELKIIDSWSVHLDSTKTIANVRSLLWPGYFAFHKANSKISAGVYIGFGIKNIDMAYMQ